MLAIPGNARLFLYQHPMSMRKSFERGYGNKNYTIIELPKLNHAFQTCMIGSWDEYEQIEETIAPSALNIMTDWILKRTTKAHTQP